MSAVALMNMSRGLKLAEKKQNVLESAGLQEQRRRGVSVERQSAADDAEQVCKGSLTDTASGSPSCSQRELHSLQRAASVPQQQLSPAQTATTSSRPEPGTPSQLRSGEGLALNHSPSPPTYNTASLQHRPRNRVQIRIPKPTETELEQAQIHYILAKTNLVKLDGVGTRTKIDYWVAKTDQLKSEKLVWRMRKKAKRVRKQAKQARAAAKLAVKEAEKVGAELSAKLETGRAQVRWSDGRHAVPPHTLWTESLRRLHRQGHQQSEGRGASGASRGSCLAEVMILMDQSRMMTDRDGIIDQDFGRTRIR